MKTDKVRFFAFFLSFALAILQAHAKGSIDPNQYPTMQKAIDAVLANESQKEWKKIAWRTDANAALAEAQKQNKPIFVFFTVKQKQASPKKWVGENSDMGKT